MIFLWKLINGKLEQTSDDTRIAFRTTISAKLIAELHETALKHHTHTNYLLETGFQHIIENYDVIPYDKKNRPKDRKHYKTTYDKELFEELKQLAIKNNLYINDVIEFSAQYIDVNESKHKNFRYRIE